MGGAPPVCAILEHMTLHGAVASDRKQGRPLVDRHAGVVSLDKLHAAQPSPIELHDVRDAGDALADQPGEDAPLTLGPLSHVAFACVSAALGAAPPLSATDHCTACLAAFPRHPLTPTLPPPLT